MDDGQARAAMIKQCRRQVLSALNVMLHIGPLSFEGLCGALLDLQLPDNECVKRDLVYLIEKGYVKWTNEAQFMPWKDRMFALTAAGSEQADKIASDPALEP
jgi:hypothetical protein